MRTPSVLAINSGSSSVKFALFQLTPAPALVRRGTIDLTGSPFSLDRLLASLSADTEDYPLGAIGHRIVHGGSSYTEPALLTDTLLADLERLVPLAPNHLPASLALLSACRRARPDVPQIVCFDTAFHAALPPESRRLPIPKAFDDQGVRRYGFHGLAFTFLMQELRRLSPERARGRVVLAHLGNGSSLAAVRGGRPIDTTMGFTPLGGVVMGTRTGDLDPGVVVHLWRTAGLDADGLEHLISHQSGLAGISGRTGDVRELLALEADDANCHLAVTIFCYEVRKRIGSFAAALGGLDVLVFSGGIGEHASSIRSRICDGLEFAGVRIDPALNAGNAGVISTLDSRVMVRVIAANEEVVIAEAAHTLLHTRSDS
jgi:acetate kinase